MKKLDLTQILLIIALAVIGYLVIFDKDPNINADLEAKSKILQEKIDSLSQDINRRKEGLKLFQKINKEWERRDSLSSIELDKLREDNKIIEKKYNNASSERKKSEKKLEDFQKNMNKEKDPVKLILDTKKRIKDND